MKNSVIILTTLFLLCCGMASSQELIVINSENLKCNDSILVFSPVVRQGETPPTLFLLHGWSGCYKDWSNKYDLQEISNQTGFRIICPDGFYNGWYMDNSDPTKMQWRKFFWSELFPKMKEKYGIKPESTFITGLSMGGHGSINIFLDDPTVFRAAGSMSGVLNLPQTSLKNSQLSKVLGEADPSNKRYQTESALYRLDEYLGKYHEEAATKILVISCGYEDSYVKGAEEFTDKCRNLGIQHILFLSKANHSWKYWGFALEQHLWIFNKILNNENLGY